MALTGLPRDANGQPLYLQLYRRIRDGVLQGAIPPGTRLPSARTLARAEGVSRNTVEAAYRQLGAEGFLVRRVGSGTRIRDDLPARLLRPLRPLSGTTGRESPGTAPMDRPAESEPPMLSERGRQIAGAGGGLALPPGMIFAPCVPGLDALPLDSWSRIAARRTRRGSRLLLSPPPAGLPALREAIAAYLHMDRGVRCTAEQIVIVNSTQQGLDLVARLLLDVGDRVWVEDPGYVAARRAFAAAGAVPVPVPVDENGIDVDAGATISADARLAYVTPSHQYPLGVTLSLARRLALLDWAERAGSWVVEDDYDSELRHDGRPLAAAQAIDESGRVLYVGTFNKVLFPGVRVAYVILPTTLVDAFATAREITDGFTSPLVQGVLAEFIGDGHFAAHLRRIRELYRERRDRFVALAREHLPSAVRLGPVSAGMHVALHLPGHVDDRRLSRRALARGVAAPALSAHALESAVRGMLVHYGYSPIADMERGVRELGRILADTSGSAAAAQELPVSSTRPRLRNPGFR